MENENNELTHWGIKGMKWGLRRYQNPDGTLTPAGRKRYNKELAKLEQKQATLKNKQATKAKLDKLDDMKRDIDARKATLKGKQPAAKVELDPDKQAALRAKILNSTDPKELYKHRDLLSTAEINERLNRLDAEKRLGSASEGKKTDLATRLDKINNLGQKMNNLYNTANGPIGRLIKEKLGFSKKEKALDVDELMSNVDKMDAKGIKKALEAISDRNKLTDAYNLYKRKESKLNERTEAIELLEQKKAAAQERILQNNKKKREIQKEIDQLEAEQRKLEQKNGELNSHKNTNSNQEKIQSVRSDMQSNEWRLNRLKDQLNKTNDASEAYSKFLFENEEPLNKALSNLYKD